MKNAEIVVGILVPPQDGKLNYIRSHLQQVLIRVAQTEGGVPNLMGYPDGLLWSFYRRSEGYQTTDCIAYYRKTVSALILSEPDSMLEIIRLLNHGIGQLPKTAFVSTGLIEGVVLGLLESLTPCEHPSACAEAMSYSPETMVHLGRFVRKLLQVPIDSTLMKEYSGHLSNLAPSLVYTLQWIEQNLEGASRGRDGAGPLTGFVRSILSQCDEDKLSPFGHQVYLELFKAFFAKLSFAEKLQLISAKVSVSEVVA